MTAMRRILITAAALYLLALATPAPSSALLLLDHDGHKIGEPWRSWAATSHAPRPPGVVVLRGGRGPCPSYAIGCAVTSTDPLAIARIWIHSAAGEERRRVLHHELGHVFDSRVMTAATRSAWKRAALVWRPRVWRVPRPQGGWRCSRICEQFATSYALCAIHGDRITHTVDGSYGYSAGPVRQRRVCSAIRAAAP